MTSPRDEETAPAMISVIICTYNRSDLLARTLASFFEQDDLDRVPHELIVVDNNSTDDTPDVIEAFAQQRDVTSVREPRQGLSVARNRGVAESRGDVVAFLDDDVLVDRAWLGRMARAFAETGAAVVGGRSHLVFEQPPPPWIGPRFRRFLSEVDLGDRRRRLPDGRSIYGLNLAFRRRALETAGGFDARLGRRGTALSGGEEQAVIDRIAADGGSIYYDPAPVVGHLITAERARWPYFRRHALDMGRTFALAQPPVGWPRQLGRMARSAAAMTLHVGQAAWCTITGRSPYARTLARREALWDLGRLRAQWALMRGAGSDEATERRSDEGSKRN